MSYESDLTSIWKGQSAMDVWYSKAVALKEEAKTTRTPSKPVYAVDEVFNRDSSTLPNAAFYDENDESEALTNDEDSTICNNRELRASIDKALPALPEINDLYFEYMFSDAEFGPQNDEGEESQIAGFEEDSQTFVVDPFLPSQYSSVYNAPSPSSADEDDLPITPPSCVLEPALFGFDGKIIKQETPTKPTFGVVDNAASFPFSFAGVFPAYSAASPPVNLAPIYSVASSINSVSPPVSFAPVYSIGSNINTATTFAAAPQFHDEETEITDATAGFYGGFAVEESPSPYHAPLIDDGAGFGDIRDGCERFPDQWTDSDTQAKLVAPYKLTGLQTFSEDLELPAALPVKPVLKPKSQLAKAAKTCNMGFSYTHRTTYTPRFTALSGFSDEVVAKLNGTKRPALDSINTVEDVNGMSPLPDLVRRQLTLVDPDYGDDEEYEFESPQSVKKARLSSDATMDADVIYAHLPSTLSIHPDLKHKSSARSITQSLLHKPVDFSAVIDGYPGQFKALIPPTKIFHPKFLSGGVPDKFTFGDEGHANGLFNHIRFQGGGNTPFSKYSFDFTQSIVPSVDGKFGKAIKIADANHDLAAETQRTVEQEALRRETHFECSLARLEGVPVGEYRYYHGHSNVEEYNKGGMCVCWSECFCTVMCSKYADMFCPCTKYLEFEV